MLWNILRDPIPIFYYDADEISQDLAPNNRPIQPLSDRVVQVRSIPRSFLLLSRLRSHGRLRYLSSEEDREQLPLPEGRVRLCRL